MGSRPSSYQLTPATRLESIKSSSGCLKPRSITRQGSLQEMSHIDRPFDANRPFTLIPACRSESPDIRDSGALQTQVNRVATGYKRREAGLRDSHHEVRPINN